MDFQNLFHISMRENFNTVNLHALLAMVVSVLFIIIYIDGTPTCSQVLNVTINIADF